ncbi:hypothetical protein BL250_00595 [Erwinia sp. OLTSP20]|uniref:hypothetical protein n=1 Tax=unclassified Erwinia TaxID=2622719 RepID=UPI000C17C655|nr:MULTISPECIES: hypothetical protein [unclassified Erwinia]PIJ52145.1 hypothetical protein BV501_00875 [Erwinia sp. OAMSP11]PIJ73106.1 hypothetical protein BK416_07540 [Erwinia sp. OLSSP12]PIJ84674.1 hypothetical protein BLD47_01695 [Erwinia sp. OLCASP19]PIJ87321.1 hypothetical protein BLD46_00840 [Erwinia sp. OLMTSP26]PIJ87524.1 hypothetical protein BLD49_05835 [Erwinia sp. OLMDSP33]
MDEHFKPADLSYLTSAMVRAARDFVDLKFQIDTKARKSPESIPEGICESMNGDEFFDCIIPFRPKEGEVSESEFLYVPVPHTFGCSWRWWPDQKYFTGEDERKIRSHIFSYHGIGNTSYIFLPSLGLFLPTEGRNRVNFCRYHNIEYVPAKVYTDTYPAADRIKLYILEKNGLRDVWGVLDNRYVQRVKHHAFALPLLSAYGVDVLHKWPGNLPWTDTLLFFENNCYEENLFKNKTIDAEALRGTARLRIWFGMLDGHADKIKFLRRTMLYLVVLVRHIFK